MPPRFEVLDVHHHVGDAFRALGGSLSPAGTADELEGADDTARRELESRLEIMDRGGVAQAVVIPGHAYERPHGAADTRRVNDHIAAYRDARPERFPAAIGITELAVPGARVEIRVVAE